MKKTLIFLGLAIFLTYGCASGRMNLVEQGQVTVEVVAKGDAAKPEVEIYQDNGVLLVKGVVESRPEGGHVHIALISPDGTLLSDETVNYRPKTQFYNALKPFPRYAGRYAYFEESIITIPPKGSKVRLIF